MQATQQANTFYNWSVQSSQYTNDTTVDDSRPRNVNLGVSLDINETSLQLLEEIDPTFWSLDTFLQAAEKFMYYRELSFPQLLRSYTASLCLQTFHKSDHYYDKSLLFEVPYNVTQDLLQRSYIHLEHLKTTGSKIKTKRINEVKDSLVKLGDLLNKINSGTPSLESAEYYQSRLWPNESSISNVVHFVPQYNDLFPLKCKKDKATYCIQSLENELGQALKSRLGLHYDFPSLYFFGGDFNSFVFNIYTEVQAWYSGSSRIPTTPRKRSIDLVVEPEAQDGVASLENAAAPTLFNSSPLTRKKSEIRKRRRFSVA